MLLVSLYEKFSNPVLITWVLRWQQTMKLPVIRHICRTRFAPSSQDTSGLRVIVLVGVWGLELDCDIKLKKSREETK